MASYQLLDIAFLIGLLVQVTKLIDLIFREHQKKLIQDKLERFTLWLDDSNPVKYFYHVFSIKYLRILLILVGIFLVYTIASDIELFKATPNFLTALVITATYIITTLIGFWLYGMKIIKLMTKGTFFRFLLIYLIIVFSFFLFIIYYYSKVHKYGPSFDDYIPSFDDFIIFTPVILLGYFGVTITLMYFGFIVIAYRIIIFLIQLLLKLGKAIMWRVVEYNKGAVAAISLILTVIIGIVDFVLKSKGSK